MTKDAYEMVSLESTVPPGKMGGTGWHCYVIGQGKNRIRGYKQGSLETVRRSVEEIVIRSNERRIGKRGRVHLIMTNHVQKVEQV